LNLESSDGFDILRVLKDRDYPSLSEFNRDFAEVCPRQALAAPRDFLNCQLWLGGAISSNRRSFDEEGFLPLSFGGLGGAFNIGGAKPIRRYMED
jgi:hypothetical protein